MTIAIPAFIAGLIVGFGIAVGVLMLLARAFPLPDDGER